MIVCDTGVAGTLSFSTNFVLTCTIAETLVGFWALAACAGHAERAMRLYGSARAIWESNHLVVWPAEQAEYEPYISRAREQIDEAIGKRAWEEGYAMGKRNVSNLLLWRSGALGFYDALSLGCYAIITFIS